MQPTTLRQQPPWVRMSEDIEYFIKPQFLPDGMLICDPSHLRRQALVNLLAHWTRREAAGSPGLTFCRIASEDDRRVRTDKGKAPMRSRSPFMDPGSDEDSNQDPHNDEEWQRERSWPSAEVVCCHPLGLVNVGHNEYYLYNIKCRV